MRAAGPGPCLNLVVVFAAVYHQLALVASPLLYFTCVLYLAVSLILVGQPARGRPCPPWSGPLCCAMLFSLNPLGSLSPPPACLQIPSLLHQNSVYSLSMCPKVISGVDFPSP